MVGTKKIGHFDHLFLQCMCRHTYVRVMKVRVQKFRWKIFGKSRVERSGKKSQFLSIFKTSFGKVAQSVGQGAGKIAQKRQMHTT